MQSPMFAYVEQESADVFSVQNNLEVVKGS